MGKHSLKGKNGMMAIFGDLTLKIVGEITDVNYILLYILKRCPQIKWLTPVIQLRKCQELEEKTSIM